MTNEKIVNYANYVSKVVGTSDPFIIASKLGINVLYKQYNKSVKGYYRKVFDKLYIIINSNFSKNAQRIICAHELGHALLHTDFYEPLISKHFEDCVLDKMEQQANMFAAALVFDQSKLRIEISQMNSFLIKSIFDANLY
ncbi:MAG: ImmA/IrrE family metallo-endopeptidase [Caulobacteraceae bacterium]